MTEKIGLVGAGAMGGAIGARLLETGNALTVFDLDAEKVAALADKDVEGVGRAMAGVVDHWYLAGLDVHRGLSGAVLKDRLWAVGLTDVSVCETVPRALTTALSSASADDLVVVFGSFHTAAQAREILLRCGLQKRAPGPT